MIPAVWLPVIAGLVYYSLALGMSPAYTAAVFAAVRVLPPRMRQTVRLPLPFKRRTPPRHSVYSVYFPWSLCYCRLRRGTTALYGTRVPHICRLWLAAEKRAVRANRAVKANRALHEKNGEGGQ